MTYLARRYSHDHSSFNHLRGAFISMSVVEGLKIQIHVCGTYVLSVWFTDWAIDWVRQRLDIFSISRGGSNSIFVHSFSVHLATRICASLGSRMKFKTLCYPVFGRNKNTALHNYFDSFQCFHSMSN